MATRFRIFNGHVAVMEDKANEFMAELEANGGEYVASHWSSATESSLSGMAGAPGIPGSVTYSLVLVYHDGKGEGDKGK